VKDNFLYVANASFIEELYQIYLKDPASLDKAWAEFFNQNTGGEINFPSKEKVIIKEEPSKAKATSQSSQVSSQDLINLKASFLKRKYQESGHFLARLDPLNLEQVKTKQDLKLNPADLGINEEELGVTLKDSYSLNDHINYLDKLYNSTIGVEFSHIPNEDEQNWLFTKWENIMQTNFSKEEKISFLEELVKSEGLEQFIHIKFPGAKRFSIEGGEAAVLALDYALQLSCQRDVKEAVIGMAHRGRLATLTNVMQKPYNHVFGEFLGKPSLTGENVAGDVKYHMGYSSERKYGDKTIGLSLCFNPSHLEAINPIAAGNVRAKQDIHKDKARRSVMNILIHGDAAFCGQGVVAESLMMSGLDGYDVGGVLHIVINNQVGFTANPKDGRRSRYCTDFAKSINVPIIHVNGGDVESVCKAVKLAIDYRAHYAKDVVIDVVCFRKYGHNEGDEPRFTQNLMYQVIDDTPSVTERYNEQLQKQNIIDNNFLSQIKSKFKELLEEEYKKAASYEAVNDMLKGKWQGLTRPLDSREFPAKTGMDLNLLKKIGLQACKYPADFAINEKIAKIFHHREELIETGKNIDWATGEMLAFASLLQEKTPIRISGQDAGRGTFSHRHSVLHSQKSKDKYIPLNNLGEGQAYYEVYDSNLSEYAVMGFEYGYSLADPKSLVIWEAQFGDFANGAQIIIDQFLSSSESKWLRMSGLVLLLPHGFEGQGPEHSSARLERFLQLAAEDNIQVINPTTPASFFHALRRQMHRNFRKPLIVMTPKSLLRNKLAVSNIEDFGLDKSFESVIDDNIDAKGVGKVVFCSGKIYYDLLVARKDRKDIALVRIEEYHPYPAKQIENVLNKYKDSKEFIWCQEEPKNMGAWNYITELLNESLSKLSKDKVKYVGRKASASPAVGYLSVHNKEQEAIVKTILGE